ncbi:MAG TPA: class I SAM-dependent RNA methyltransferase [Verrucomicrobiae bacterium]|nr:class I SAM-dependent RNA methyltransferase [Verrucomicrobiae bacterium]
MSIAPGNIVTLQITDIAFGGEGVGRLEQLVVFVPFVAIGEIVEAEITELKKSFGRARLVRVVQASAERVSPPCQYFGACGGCQYQHLSYAGQLRIKHKQICDLFERIGKIPRDHISPVVPCPNPYGYRNRVMIRSQWNKPEQRLNIGFVRWDCGLVEDITECKIAEPAVSDQIRQVRANPPPKGGIKVVLRLPPEGWEVPRDSFFQNNFFLLPEMVKVVRQLLGDSGSTHLIDLFCGVGFFGIELSSSVESFIGVEFDHMAIKAARNNARARGALNGEFIAGPVEEIVPEILGKFHADTTTVLLDPPRKGCRPDTLQLLREQGPSQIIYVSCHPATMARDLNILCSGDVFKLVRVVPLDMFPQTQHVECIADLRLNVRLPQPAGNGETNRVGAPAAGNDGSS